jgi:hypothetical protein
MSIERLTEHKQNAKTCRICGKCFDNETELVAHELTVHPNVRSPEPGTKEGGGKNDKAA